MAANKRYEELVDESLREEVATLLEAVLAVGEGKPPPFPGRELTRRAQAAIMLLRATRPRRAFTIEVFVGADSEEDGRRLFRDIVDREDVVVGGYTFGGYVRVVRRDVSHEQYGKDLDAFLMLVEAAKVVRRGP